jgi:hypothetical protein
VRAEEREPHSVEDKSVTIEQTSHITVIHTSVTTGGTIKGIYAISEDIWRELNRQTQKPTGYALTQWLAGKGCQLDSSDGPAWISRGTDGSTLEMYYRDGKLHREDGPAIVRRNTDGSTVKMYYRDGNLQQFPRPAIPGVTIERPTPKAPDTPRAPGPP